MAVLYHPTLVILYFYVTLFYHLVIYVFVFICFHLLFECVFFPSFSLTLTTPSHISLTFTILWGLIKNFGTGHNLGFWRIVQHWHSYFVFYCLLCATVWIYTLSVSYILLCIHTDTLYSFFLTKQLLSLYTNLISIKSQLGLVILGLHLSYICHCLLKWGNP